MIDRDEILRQLDSGAESFDFPMLDNGYYYHGDQKLTIFRDNTRWAMSIEILAFNSHENDIDGITTIAEVFGNCITEWNDNSNFNHFADDDGVKIFLYDETNCTPYLNPEARSIMIRDKRIPIIVNRQHYLTKGIVFQDSDRITPWEFMRGLIPEYSNLFWLTKLELSKNIPSDLSVFGLLKIGIILTLGKMKDRAIPKHLGSLRT
jgi:hypothetical protein